MLTTPLKIKKNTTVAIDWKKNASTSSFILGLVFEKIPFTKRIIATPAINKMKICVLITFIINFYYTLNITSPNQEAKHSPGKVTEKY